LTDVRFDWADHNGGHVLDQPHARVLFVFPNEYKAHAEYNEALASLPDVKRFKPGERIWFESGSELAFHSLASDENNVLKGMHHRIVVEDLQTVIPDSAESSIAVRSIADRLICGAGIEPRLYLTYSTGSVRTDSRRKRCD